MPSRERACGGIAGHVGRRRTRCARRRRDVAGDQIEHRRFAGAVRPDHAQGFAIGDGELDRVHGLERAVELGHTVKFQKYCHESCERMPPRMTRGGFSLTQEEAA